MEEWHKILKEKVQGPHTSAQHFEDLSAFRTIVKVESALSRVVIPVLKEAKQNQEWEEVDRMIKRLLELVDETNKYFDYTERMDVTDKEMEHREHLRE